MTTFTVHRWVDLVDRAGWTFVQAFAATLLVLGLDDWRKSLASAAVAGAIAAVKTMAGQQTGESPLGDAVPGASVLSVKPNGQAGRPA